MTSLLGCQCPRCVPNTTIVKVHCPICETQQLLAEQILIAWITTGVAEYSFWCGQCAEHRVKDAGPDALKVLHIAGLDPETYPPEYAQHDGPALTDDDLDVFVVALRTVDWVVVQAGEDVHRIPTADAGGTS